MNLINGRKELIRTRAGSYNYNLMTESSDIDYKIYISPTKEDLYEGRKYTKDIIGEDIDYNIHDIRKLENLLFKSNINFLEGLFSDSLLITNKYKESDCVNDKTVKLIQELLGFKSEIATINLPYLFNSCVGMSITKKKSIYKDIDKNNIEMARKNMMTCYRVLDFLERFHNTHFEDFKSSIRYDNGEKDKLLNIRKYGDIVLMEKVLEDKIKKIQSIESDYKKHCSNNHLKKIIHNIIFEIVFINL